MSFVRDESHTNKGEELEGMSTVVDTQVDVEVIRSLFNTSTMWSLILFLFWVRNTFACHNRYIILLSYNTFPNSSLENPI